jgi:hypothetical protein
VAASPDGDSVGSVALVAFEVEEERDLLDPGLAHELNADGVRLRAVRLPEGAVVVVAELVDPVAGLGAAQSPDRLVPDFLAGGGGGGRDGGVDVVLVDPGPFPHHSNTQL